MLRLITLLVLVALILYLNAQNISPLNRGQRGAAQEITRMIDIDEFRRGMRSGTLWSIPAQKTRIRQNVRIDNQGAVNRDGRVYYNIQLQIGTRTYAAILAPAGVRLGRRAIRRAIAQSMQTQRQIVMQALNRGRRILLLLEAEPYGSGFPSGKWGTLNDSNQTASSNQSAVITTPRILRTVTFNRFYPGFFPGFFPGVLPGFFPGFFPRFGFPLLG